MIRPRHQVVEQQKDHSLTEYHGDERPTDIEKASTNERREQGRGQAERCFLEIIGVLVTN